MVKYNSKKTQKGVLKKTILFSLLLSINSALFSFISIDVPQKSVPALNQAKNSIKFKGRTPRPHITIMTMNNHFNNGGSFAIVDNAIKSAIAKFNGNSIQVHSTGNNKYFGFNNKCIVHEIAPSGGITQFQNLLYNELTNAGVAVDPLSDPQQFAPHISLVDRIQTTNQWPVGTIYNRSQTIRFNAYRIRFAGNGTVKTYKLGNKTLDEKKRKSHIKINKPQNQENKKISKNVINKKTTRVKSTRNRRKAQPKKAIRVKNARNRRKVQPKKATRVKSARNRRKLQPKKVTRVKSTRNRRKVQPKKAIRVKSARNRRKAQPKKVTRVKSARNRRKLQPKKAIKVKSTRNRRKVQPKTKQKGRRRRRR